MYIYWQKVMPESFEPPATSTAALLHLIPLAQVSGHQFQSCFDVYDMYVWQVQGPALVPEVGFGSPALPARAGDILGFEHNAQTARQPARAFG